MAENAPNLGPFTEYQYFEPVEGDETGLETRQAQNTQFQTGIVTNPKFEYHKLDRTELDERHEDYVEAIATETDEEKKALLIARQRGVEIAAASLDLQEAETPRERWESGRRLAESSERRYGELNPTLFWPIVAAKAEAARSFTPGNLHAEMTQKKVLDLLPEIPAGTERNELLSQELLDRIRPDVMRYLEPILRVIPAEGSFTSAQITEMAQQALANVGLADEGWEPFQNAEADKFSVKNTKKQMIIPNPPAEEGVEYTKTADELRRLFAHEIGVHAMRRDKSLGQDFEEGLGILMECVVSNSTDGVAIQRAENRYLHAGLADGLGGVRYDPDDPEGVSRTVRNARQVFEITWRLEALKLAKNGSIGPETEAKAKKAVQPHIDNIFRGTGHDLPGVYYNRAKVYLEGIIQAAGYAGEHADDPDWLPKLIANGP